MDVLAGPGVVAEDAEKAAMASGYLARRVRLIEQSVRPVVQGIPQNAPLSDTHGGASLSQFTLPTTAPGSPAQNTKEPKTKHSAKRKATMQKEPKPSPKTSGEKSTSKSASGAPSSSSKRCYKKRRTGGLEGFLAAGPTIDEAIAAGLIPPLPEGDTKEIRKQRRLIRNRVSAQLHRERKKLYVENLSLEFRSRQTLLMTSRQNRRTQGSTG